MISPEELAKAMASLAPKQPVTEFAYGNVVGEDSAGRLLVSFSEDYGEATCAKLVDASVGDRVLAAIMPNGRCAAIGKVGVQKGAALPVGAVVMYGGGIGGGVALPEGWLLCNGNSFDSGEYPELAEALGGTAGPYYFDGYFHTPDLRRRIPGGADYGYISEMNDHIASDDISWSAQYGTLQLTIINFIIYAGGRHDT